VGDLVTGAVGIAGVLLGLFADRVLQRQGKVRCVMEPIRLWIVATHEDDLTVRTLPLPEGILDEEVVERNRDYGGGNEAIRLFVEAKLFNNKEVKTGIRDVVVVFEGRATVEQKMLDRSTWRPSSRSRQMDYLEVVNLPSREWVSLSLLGEIALEDARKLTECDKAWLRGYLPDDTRFNERIPFAE
jgi:hypothetical protein